VGILKKYFSKDDKIAPFYGNIVYTRDIKERCV